MTLINCVYNNDKYVIIPALSPSTYESLNLLIVMYKFCCTAL